MRDDLFDPRLTEQRNPRTLDIDLASELEIVDSINAEDRLVLFNDRFQHTFPQVAKSVHPGARFEELLKAMLDALT